MPDAPNTPESKPLKATLNLPQTTFSMKANLPVNEPIRLEAWAKEDLYGQIRAARTGSPKYILHDGPPYANGAIHLGHALNKCIKDFVVKTKTMAGFDAPYVPGWDCHGLPIEIKVDEQLGRKKLDMDPVAVRKACRAYAEKYVDLQRSQFQRLGVFGRWDNPYKTMSFEYEAAIVETFYEFYEREFVYKGLKPVFWCIHDRTALAEAEVEYEQHTSPSIYVRYALTGDATAIDPAFADLSGQAGPVYTIIWTTTPWTIPASQAVAFNPEMEYVALACAGGTYIIAEALLASVVAACDLKSAAAPDEAATQADVLVRFAGSRMEGATFQHPFLDRSILGVNAPYVTAEQGTGAVHTSPAHGVDDFYTGKRYNLPELQYVDNAGKQKNTNGQPYEDLTVFKSNPVITEILRESGALLSASTLLHSYPHCWRCHNPVIVRATEQWFIAMETPMHAAVSEEETQEVIAETLAADPDATAVELPPTRMTTFRQRTLEEIKRVNWDPSWGEERISNMIATRPDWCISRQRIWGVPIAVFLCCKCSTPLRNPAINAKVVDLFRKEGADAWYVHSPEQLLPAGTACAQCGNADTTEFRKEMDILDVWFESGASWHAVLDIEPELEFPADLYTEGGDQHRGWFHSSLLTSVAVREEAPYKMVATSGWTLDEQGRAFSKSLGNGVDPVDVAKRLGGEIIRLWVASVDFREDVAASESLMQRVSDNYRKLRNTLRFLLSNIHDFNPATDAITEFAKLEPLDQHILSRTAELDAKIRHAYDTFEFHRAYHALNEYVNTDLSALYLDVLKDRLYTLAPNAPARRSAQTALWRIAETLTRLVAPILSFTAEEVWAHLPKIEGREASVHVALFPNMQDIIPGSVKQIEEDWKQLLAIRVPALKALEEARNEKLIGKGLEASIRFEVSDSDAATYDLLARYGASLPELMNVSSVEVARVSTLAGAPLLETTAKFASGIKCERCWRYTEDVGQDGRFPTVCERCSEALIAIGYPPYDAPPSSEAA
ncbi:isoleucine--tRNA ligase [Granulicella sibirica]|uniref:Isoleucine--tRNA ligase n=1 Tax=Granulicella sibirica TaxID=2479048 RepID=A0A4Q0T5H0_9BACT|nr:isoleucine--tRNA ligase [Granulicella sibirica]RXH56866.1 Isoleucyl-tRNA synthetase [Granulicella sibirica]